MGEPKPTDLSALKLYLSPPEEEAEERTDLETGIFAEARNLFAEAKAMLLERNIDDSTEAMKIIRAITTNSTFKGIEIDFRESTGYMGDKADARFPKIVLGNYPSAAYNFWFEEADNAPKGFIIACNKVPPTGNFGSIKG